MAANDWFLLVSRPDDEDRFQTVTVLEWLERGALVIGREPSPVQGRGVSDNRPTPMALDRLYKEPKR